MKSAIEIADKILDEHPEAQALRPYQPTSAEITTTKSEIIYAVMIGNSQATFTFNFRDGEVRYCYYFDMLFRDYGIIGAETDGPVWELVVEDLDNFNVPKRD